MKDRQTTIRKAAILIASLEQATAAKLLAQMSREQSEAILCAVDELESIDSTEQEAVINEFFRIGPMLPEDQPAGIDLDGQLAKRYSDHSHQDELAISDGASPPRCSSRAPFDFLQGAAGSSLAGRLQHEHPQTIAVVVSHLPPENGADLLASLSPSLQAEVARRLVDLDETDPEVLLEIERGLEAWLNEHQRSSRRRTAGMMALQGILAAADPFSHESLLANLSRHDHRLATQLVARGGRPFAFAELQELDDSSLRKVFVHSDQDVLTQAMAGAGRAMVARACRVLPVARAARLRRDLDRLGSPRVQDEVERAQQAIADLAGDLDRRGELTGFTGRKLSLAV